MAKHILKGRLFLPVTVATVGEFVADGCSFVCESPLLSLLVSALGELLAAP